MTHHLRLSKPLALVPDPTMPDDGAVRLTTLRAVARQSRLVSLRPGEADSLAFTATAADT